ncbi:hypothetical protein SLEP1_g45435 [Rubroshorea leprosula]|uniref:Uncharacterized protein n=1 Tax=Rubroshorea leprosula TaxID=152421 RepID=A0AAV5LJ31_9ROSI|nr:hypothetical protein SLEP1_g45435 [Rubroshorea leprosula]
MYGKWPPYPPCVNDDCTTRPCCAGEYKYAWPELVGKKWPEAEATINGDNPYVTCIVIDKAMKGFGDFCCNRVYLYVDIQGPNGVVKLIPQVPLNPPPTNLLSQPPPYSAMSPAFVKSASGSDDSARSASVE